MLPLLHIFKFQSSLLWPLFATYTIALALSLFGSCQANEHGKRVKTSLSIVNEKNLYTISVGFGSPPQYHNLGIATGSANTYAGNIKPYQLTPTTIVLDQPFFIPYGFGNATGKLVSDTLILGKEQDSVTLRNFTVGNVTRLNVRFDGLLGLGLSAQSYPRNSQNIGTLLTPTGLLYDRDVLESVMFGLSFMPTSKHPDPNGLLTIGGIEPSRFTGNITWYPCSSYFTWDWKATISYGDNNLSDKSLMGVFDTSYTNSPALPREIFDKYVLSIPGALWDDSWQAFNPYGVVNKYMLRIPRSSVAEMEDLCFTAGGVPWCLCPEAQLVPDGVITDGDPEYRYGYVTPLRDEVDQKAGFIFGMKAMERFYVAFDLAGYQIGLAKTEWTESTF
ncbi:hypothetical protein O181_005541 [Austropuccinia psidii MF-1]|uniref:Peptidase A1 domain-containing protein n=1 Tax=Austropuccinia psidii MF-1 TaxID=1389203 RepID=A0A9Q3BHF8_9BASI|nr:hypothetical protein [Austropuccinia psidii MF-1]